MNLLVWWHYLSIHHPWPSFMDWHWFWDGDCWGC